MLCSGGYLSNYYEFVGVESCEDVFTLYVFIWVLAGLNLMAFFTGILTTAVLGSVKSVVRSCRNHVFIRVLHLVTCESSELITNQIYGKQKVTEKIRKMVK